MTEYLQPGVTYTSRLDLGPDSTGLVGTVRYRLIDNDLTPDDPIFGPVTADIIEDPTGSGTYLFTGTAPLTPGKYSRAWDDGVDTDDLFFDEDIVISTTTSPPVPFAAYADTDELARILKLRSPTTEQVTAMQRCLIAASTEINSEVGRTTAYDFPYPDLAVEVCLERARELWQMEEAAFGVVGLGGDVPLIVRVNTWERHSYTLSPLKETWGVG